MLRKILKSKSAAFMKSRDRAQIEKRKEELRDMMDKLNRKDDDNDRT